MALIKPTLAGSELFGQIGGQNISLTKNGSVIRNTTYSNKAGTTAQTKARAQMAGITNKWQFLSPATKALWASTATNYQYKDSAGNTKTRNGFQTFCFCNRNLLELGKAQLTSPATFAGVTLPIVTNNSTDEKEFIIQNSATDANAEYLIFAQVHNSVGAISYTPTFVKVATITNAQFSAGYDVFDDIINNAVVPDFRCSVTLGIFAVNVNNGNRTTAVVTINQIINPFGLGLDILSYYQFINNANDFYNVNNSILDTVTYSQNGIVDYSADFDGNSTKYINLGNSSTWNFGGVSEVGPHSVCGWVNLNQIKINQLLFRFGTGIFSGAPSMALLLVNSTFFLVCYSANFANRAEISIAQTLSTGTNYFFAYTYIDSANIFVVLDTAQSSLINTFGSFVGMATSTAPMSVGRHGSVTSRTLNGELSELTYFNEALTYSQLMDIRTANLAGDTILDIN